MMVLRRNSHRSTSELLMSVARATAFLCSDVSFGLMPFSLNLIVVMWVAMERSFTCDKQSGGTAIPNERDYPVKEGGGHLHDEDVRAGHGHGGNERKSPRH